MSDSYHLSVSRWWSPTEDVSVDKWSLAGSIMSIAVYPSFARLGIRLYNATASQPICSAKICRGERGNGDRLSIFVRSSGIWVENINF